jgi:hypothetical protein
MLDLRVTRMRNENLSFGSSAVKTAQRLYYFLKQNKMICPRMNKINQKIIISDLSSSNDSLKFLSLINENNLLIVILTE